MMRISSYLQMAEISNNFKYLLGAANYLDIIGKYLMEKIPNPSATIKSNILCILNASLKIAQKAPSVADSDADKVKLLLEDIQKNIRLTEKI